jgi:hypothetical protein
VAPTEGTSGRWSPSYPVYYAPPVPGYKLQLSVAPKEGTGGPFGFFVPLRQFRVRIPTANFGVRRFSSRPTYSYEFQRIYWTTFTVPSDFVLDLFTAPDFVLDLSTTLLLDTALHYNCPHYCTTTGPHYCTTTVHTTAPLLDHTTVPLLDPFSAHHHWTP